MIELSPEAEKYIYSNGVQPNKQATMAEFLTQSCTRPFTTPNLNRAIVHYRQVPTEPRIRYLRAKADARKIEPYLGFGFRDFLHSAYTQLGEGTELPAVLDAIMSYRESGKRATLENILIQKKVIGFFPTEAKRQQLFDLSAYEQVTYDPVTGEEVPISSIVDRIRDYVKYLPSAYKESPITSDSGLNEKLETVVEEGINSRTIESTFSYLNQRNLDRIRNQEACIDPDLINAMEWLDMKMGGYLYHLSFEKQSQAYQENWYKTLLMHQELVGSAHDFDTDDFEQRIKTIRSLRSSRDTAEYVMNMTRSRQEKLRKMYQTDYLHDIFVYVAGLIDISLMIPITARLAETVQGERSRDYHATSIFKAIGGYHHRGD